MATTRKSDLQSQAAEGSGDERRILPSDIDMAATQFGLTHDEADGLVRSGRVTQAEADKIKGARTVYRVRYEAIEPTAAHDLRAKADAAAEEAAASARVEVLGEQADADPAKPESGPYGPNADYVKVDLPADKDAQ